MRIAVRLLGSVLLAGGVEVCVLGALMFLFAFTVTGRIGYTPFGRYLYENGIISHGTPESAAAVGIGAVMVGLGLLVFWIGRRVHRKGSLDRGVPRTSSEKVLDVIDKSFSFRGRTRRLAFWKVLGILFVMVSLASLVMTTIFVSLLAIAPLLVWVPVVWIALATSARRWHDANISGWMALTLFIPFVNFVTIVVCGCLPSTVGSNKYDSNLDSQSSRADEASPLHAPPSKTICDQCGNRFESGYYLERSQDGRYVCEQCRAQRVSSASTA